MMMKEVWRKFWENVILYNTKIMDEIYNLQKINKIKSINDTSIIKQSFVDKRLSIIFFRIGKTAKLWHSQFIYYVSCPHLFYWADLQQIFFLNLIVLSSSFALNFKEATWRGSEKMERGSKTIQFLSVVWI